MSEREFRFTVKFDYDERDGLVQDKMQVIFAEMAGKANEIGKNRGPHELLCGATVEWEPLFSP